MKINDAGLTIIKSAEGCSLKPYRCPAGIWTIGFGHTAGVSASTPTITKTEAEELLKRDVRTAENAITMQITSDLNENQFSALVSFVFNIGMGAFRNSTLRKVLNNGNYERAANEFLRWDKVNGVPSKGLTRRREEERELFLTEVA